MAAELHGVDPRSGEQLPGVVETNPAELDRACALAAATAPRLEQFPGAERARLLHAVADALAGAEEELVTRADTETALGTSRLHSELARTTGQLRMFAELVASGADREVISEETDPNAAPVPRPALHRVLRPIGPVAVYAAGNFPFAFSIAGGDTASALASGCPVVVKAHPGHPVTSQRTGELVQAALTEAGAPAGSFATVHGYAAGERLVADPRVAAAAFTGSQRGGRALFDLATSRPDPIPFYGELGSVNPVFVTEQAVASRGSEIVDGFVGSFTLGGGQFCTKPGVLLLPAGHGLDGALTAAVRQAAPAALLTAATSETFQTGVADRGGRGGVRTLHTGDTHSPGHWAAPALHATDVATLHADPSLLEECFGPTAMVVEYTGEAELARAARLFPGSLTATVHAEDNDDELVRPLLAELARRAGRIVWNGWPTGVAVTAAMHHGGPWPATTAPLHTSVGTTAIRRFLVPVTYQNVPARLLP